LRTRVLPSGKDAMLIGMNDLKNLIEPNLPKERETGRNFLPRPAVIKQIGKDLVASNLPTLPFVLKRCSWQLYYDGGTNLKVATPRAEIVVCSSFHRNITYLFVAGMGDVLVLAIP
jgi:hypothetical protein